MSQYYYLISSLPELARDGAFLSHPYPVFEEFVREELHPDDYSDLKRCFLFNDISNIALLLESGDDGAGFPMLTPSGLNRDELRQAVEDPETSFSVPADIIHDILAERRLYPNKSVYWELMYRTLSALAGESDGSPGFSGFPLNYIIFEARLRNLTTALSYRKTGRAYSDEIIPFDTFSQSIAISGSADFGIFKELGVMENLLEVFTGGSPLETEKLITSTRWKWLDDEVDYHVFSKEAVFAYAIRIADIQHQLNLTPEEGRRSLDGLLNSLQKNIRSITQEEYSE